MNDSTKGLTSGERVGSAILSRVAPRRRYGRRSASPAGARDRDRSRRPARPGRLAATVLVVGLVLLGAAAAEAQTERILVSNTAVADDDTANTSGNDHAQLFHTGGHTDGYTLTGVFLNSEDTEGDDFDVEICEEDGSADEFPSSTCTALTAPSSFTAGFVRFTGNLLLSANTNYVVVIKQRGTGSVRLKSTTNIGEDTSLGLSGWSIKNKFYFKSGSTWMIKPGSNEALRIVVRGYEGVAVTATDATLSALSVSGATLSPAFDAATTDYRTTVANAVSQVTITETTSESTATVEYLDGSDATRTDADTMTAGLQVNLSVGSNIVKVKVTAPDTTTTQTYTVNVFRVAVPVACSPASMTGRIWTGNLTVGSSGSVGSSATGYAHDPGNPASDYGSLSDNGFGLAGISYDIRSVSISVVGSISLDDLQLRIRPALGDQASHLTLHLGSDSFALAAATNPQATTFSWSNHGLSWADGNAVCLALTALTVDGIRPTLVTTGSEAPTTSTDGTQVILTFSENLGSVDRTKITIGIGGGNVAQTSAARTVGTTVELDLSTVIDATVMLTVALDADAVEDGAGNGNLAVAATPVINAITANASPAFSAATATRSVPENSPASTHVGAPVTATDGDNDPLAYSLEGTAAAAFEIVSTSGQIRTTAGETYDRETQSSYAVTVKADDGNGGTDTIAVTITLTNVIEPPGRPAAPSVSSVAGSTTSLSVMWTAPENTGPAIDTYDLRYRQGTSGSWINGPQNVSGTSATISGLTANTLYQVQVLATSGEGGSPWSPSGSGQTNTAGNTAPTFSSPTASRSVPENSAAGTNVGAPVTATDADSGDTLTYTLDGTDAASFDIVSTSGQIQTRSGVTYDYETKSSYAVIVKAADGNGGSDTIMVTITVTDVDESPSPGPGPEPGPVPAVPLLGHLLLALGLTAAGARVIRRRPRVPPAA